MKNNDASWDLIAWHTE